MLIKVFFFIMNYDQKTGNENSIFTIPELNLQV